MTLEVLLALAAEGSFVAFGLAVSAGVALRSPWRLPLLAWAGFVALTTMAALELGPLGFAAEHTRNLWSSQITFDFLLFASVAWAFVAPRARRQGMPLVPWFIATAALGSLGFMLFLARLLYLERRSERR